MINYWYRDHKIYWIGGSCVVKCSFFVMWMCTSNKFGFISSVLWFWRAGKSVFSSSYFTLIFFFKKKDLYRWIGEHDIQFHFGFTGLFFGQRCFNWRGVLKYLNNYPEYNQLSLFGSSWSETKKKKKKQAKNYTSIIRFSSVRVEGWSTIVGVQWKI